jgi:DHA1 family tetracycline resistance protein-like MFS transporter
MNETIETETPPEGPVIRPPGHARALATVWFTLFLDLVSFGLILPVLPFYATNFGASPAVVALLSTVFSLAQFVMSPVLGRLSDRRGRRRIMLISIAGSAMAQLVLGLSTALWMVFLARLVSGICNANVSTAHAYVADRVAPHERARYMGMMGSAIGLGFVVGPIIGGLLSLPSMPHLPFFVAAGLSALNFLMAVAWLPESRRPEGGVGPTAPRRSLRALLRRDVWATPIGVFATIALGFYMAFSSMESSFALFTEARFSWTARETGYYFTFVGLVIALMQGLVVGRAVRRLGERRTLLVGLAVLGAGFLMQGGIPSVVGLVLGGLFAAGGNGLLNPSLSALVSRTSSKDDQGLNMGLVQSASSLGRITGPALAGPLFEVVAPGAPLLFAGLVVLAVLLFARSRVPDPPPLQPAPL